MTARLFRLAPLLCIAALFLAGCASRGPAPEPVARPAVTVSPLAPDKATLYVFNIGASALLGRGQSIAAGGKRLVSVPRDAYTVLTLAADRYDLYPESASERRVSIDAQAGQAYYLIVGFTPELPWARPFAIDGLAFGLVSGDRARELAQVLKRVAPER